MARLIEVQDLRLCACPFAIRPDDVIFFHAMGGRVQQGTDVIELVGVFMQSVCGDTGQIFTPEGPPNAVLFRALSPGVAQIDVVSGDFHHTEASSLLIKVEA